MAIRLVLAVLAATASPAHGAERDGEIARAAAAARCPLDPAAPFGAALEKFPGQPDSMLRAVATLTGPADADGLGSLCVGVVRGDGASFVAVATLRPADRPTPPGDIDPVTNVYVGIDRTPFHFMPTETAFAVRATGEFNSSSTNASWSTLYLFRRTGTSLSPIFHARIDEQTNDKTGSDPVVHRRWSVSFDVRMHHGAYDLLLATAGRTPRRFIWNGVHYGPAPR